MHYARQTYYRRIRRDSACNTFQEPIITSVIDVKKITAWGESGFPARFLGDFCLEIETAPDRRAQYFYVDERDGNDFGEEGDVPGNEERVRRWAINIADAIAELH